MKERRTSVLGTLVVLVGCSPVSISARPMAQFDGGADAADAATLVNPGRLRVISFGTRLFPADPVEITAFNESLDQRWTFSNLEPGTMTEHHEVSSGVFGWETEANGSSEQSGAPFSLRPNRDHALVVMPSNIGSALYIDEGSPSEQATNDFFAHVSPGNSSCRLEIAGGQTFSFRDHGPSGRARGQSLVINVFAARRVNAIHSYEVPVSSSTAHSTVYAVDALADNGDCAFTFFLGRGASLSPIEGVVMTPSAQ